MDNGMEKIGTNRSMEGGTDSKERFSNRVDAYVRHRPDYPPEALDCLTATVGMGPGARTADIGAGTGIMSGLLLDRGVEVIAVEPNRAMREAAERRLGVRAGFRAVDGAAERTTLGEASVDFIVCAQAFHWFDQAAAQTEFRRILKPGGKAALVWNTRLTAGTPFLEGYEKLLLELGTDYAKVNHRNVTPDKLAVFFRPGALREARFPYRQLFDFEGLSGRLRSSSYATVEGDPRHAPMMAELRRLFDRCERGGVVSFDYVTEIYWGEV